MFWIKRCGNGDVLSVREGGKERSGLKIWGTYISEVDGCVRVLSKAGKMRLEPNSDVIQRTNGNWVTAQSLLLCKYKHGDSKLTRLCSCKLGKWRSTWFGGTGAHQVSVNEFHYIRAFVERKTTVGDMYTELSTEVIVIFRVQVMF